MCTNLEYQESLESCVYCAKLLSGKIEYFALNALKEKYLNYLTSVGDLIGNTYLR